MNAKIVSGIQTVMTHSRLSEAITDADWIITGEGRFDSQSLRGKVVSGIVQLAETVAGTDTPTCRIAILAGQIHLESTEFRKFGITEAIGCMDNRMTLEYAMENSATLLAEAAKKLTLTHLKPNL